MKRQELYQKSAVLGIDVRAFDVLDSTNSEAKRIALSVSPERPVLIVAGVQTAGRGRNGNTFYSSKGGAYFSLLLPVQSIPAAVSLTSAASVAVFRAIRSVLGMETGIKWVNDLYYDEKKVCGILCESTVAPNGQSYVIVGIGINIAEQEFPKELEGIAGTLRADVKNTHDLMIETVRNLFALMDSDEWITDYRNHSIVIGREVCFSENGQDHFGFAVGIDGQGRLQVRLSDGSVTALSSGEIHLRTV